jgi:antirestriction protein
MTNLNLKPSDIMYSQNSIGNKFKNGDQIGEVLDDIMEDRLSISKLPTIEVKCIDGSYVSSDNRRLWILKHFSYCWS